MEKKGFSFIALAIFAGLFFGAYILGKSIEKFKSSNRYISVKGFAEREVKSDFAIWSLKISIASDVLQDGNKSLANSRSKVIEFLNKNGINTAEITQQDLTVSDKMSQDYVNPLAPKSPRYRIAETIEVRSTDVDAVQKVSRMTNELLDAGVALAPNWNALKFIFTKLNAIKPEMLSEATANAKKAAEQFAKESNTTLGKMRKANQGLFSISDRDAALAGNYSNGKDLFKKIRVVISADYSIE